MPVLVGDARRGDVHRERLLKLGGIAGPWRPPLVLGSLVQLTPGLDPKPLARSRLAWNRHGLQGTREEVSR